MTEDECRSVIHSECMTSSGFAFQIRGGNVDSERFNQLVLAIDTLTPLIAGHSVVDRVTVGCLFELPWELENCVQHYSQKSPALGKQVSEMADRLRAAINDLLWTGLEKYYQ